MGKIEIKHSSPTPWRLYRKTSTTNPVKRFRDIKSNNLSFADFIKCLIYIFVMTVNTSVVELRGPLFVGEEVVRIKVLITLSLISASNCMPNLNGNNMRSQRVLKKRGLQEKTSNKLESRKQQANCCRVWRKLRAFRKHSSLGRWLVSRHLHFPDGSLI